MRSTAARLIWSAGAVACVAVIVAVLSVWRGTCTEFAAGGGECTYAPAVGAAESVVLSLVAIGGAVFCVVQAVRSGARG